MVTHLPDNTLRRVWALCNRCFHMLNEQYGMHISTLVMEGRPRSELIQWYGRGRIITDGRDGTQLTAAIPTGKERCFEVRSSTYCTDWLSLACPKCTYMDGSHMRH